MSDLTQLSAARMAQLVRDREISPVELVDRHLGRIEQLNPKLNAFIHVDSEGARRQARAVEERIARGERVGPLNGVPISITSPL